MTGALKLGTRGSALAMTQSGHVATAIESVTGRPVELVKIRTEGDINQGPLANIGGTGVFVTAVRAAMLAGEVDLIVHSFKDLPTAIVEGITLALVPPREDPSDALCARDCLTLADLPYGARVGTGSPRRAAQLLRVRPDLLVTAIRGNVPTRLGKVQTGELDAVVLATAGLNRLGLGSQITQRFTPDIMLPAPGQGALAVECRDVDTETDWYRTVHTELDSPSTRAAALAEREFLSVLEAGCTAPVGASAVVQADGLALTGAVFALDGTAEIRESAAGAAGRAQPIGRALAEKLLAGGAKELMVSS